MYSITFFLKGTDGPILKSVSTPNLATACTLLRVLRMSGYAARMWYNTRTLCA